MSFLFASAQGLIGPGRNREGAWAWIKFLQSKDGLDTWAGDARLLTPRRSLNNHPALTTQPNVNRYGLREIMLRAAESVRGEEVHAWWLDTSAETIKALQTVYTGEKTVRQAMNELVPVLNTLMSRSIF